MVIQKDFVLLQEGKKRGAMIGDVIKGHNLALLGTQRTSSGSCANRSTFCGFHVESPQWNQTYLNVKAQINIQTYAWVICLQFTVNGATPGFLHPGDITGNYSGFSGFQLWRSDTDLNNPSVTAHRINVWVPFYSVALNMDEKLSGEATWG